MDTVVIIWIVGMLISGFVYRARAGLGIWHRISPIGSGGTGLEWFFVTVGKVLVWPVVCALWVVKGTPEPRIVFNEKAEARRRLIDASGGSLSTSHDA